LVKAIRACSANVADRLCRPSGLTGNCPEMYNVSPWAMAWA
jgi:hypothetical protein